MRFGKTQVQGSIAGDCWQRVYSTTLDSAATSVTISSLDGNTDKEYMLICRVVNGYNGEINFGLRFNNDSGTNYGYQNLIGNNTTLTAARNTDTYATLGYCAALSDKCLSETILYAKSGYVRTNLTNYCGGIATTTVTAITIRGNSWNNTANNITSLVILVNQANGLGIGTVIELWKRIDKV